MASMRASGTCLRVAAVHRQVPVNASRASRASKVPSRVVTRANATTRRRRRFGALAADDDDGAVAEEEEEEEEEEVTPLDNVCFVLCRPQGPQNIGGIARVMQNFGVTDLRIVSPEPTALAPPFDAADEYDRAIHSAEVRATAPLSDEAHKFAVHADWLLRDAKRCANADEALADVAYVAATTARPRENLQIVDVKAAAAALREHAAKGEKVAVVFGNEATGLTNDELSRANLGVMIATAGSKASVKAANRRRRYTGAKGPTSLNLSMAVGVLAYELFEAMGEGEVGGFGSRMMTVDERARLGDELAGARRSLDVMRESSSGEESVGVGGG
jgi:tRNA C32,U32 (ribose-2'-O)-methylase TrmJ